MLEQILRLFVIAALGLSIFPGCSSMTSSGRQQAAYARYVKKYSHNRVKQKRKFAKVKMPAAPQPQNAVDSNVSQSPQSVSSNSGEN